MSANIPEHMLLSDLLKATGYDCPSNLQGKTFKEATAGDQPTKLYAFGTAEAVIYTLSIPSSPSKIPVYVPGVTGLSKGTGTYSKNTNSIKISASQNYSRYETGDLTL